ncbi:MAG TPA: hypothetical protein VJ694_02030 [Patescibacteria group bacterium]|nr:hypothetical protein [Patescibacteria group bacterium]
MKTRLAVIAAALLLVGAGCDLSKKIEWRLPFSLEKALPASDPGAATSAIVLKPGLAFTVRPSALGVSGAIDEALGLDARALGVEVTDADPERALALAWKTGSATGTLALGAFDGAHAMLLPAFWTTGDAAAEANGGLWLSRAAYDQLEAAGKTEWRLGLAEHAFSTLSLALKTFNDLAAKLSGSATATQAASPFTIEKTAVIEAYPLTVDGRIVLVKAVKATSWFADFLVLENRDNPLILKVTVNPVAAPALRALEKAEIRWEELGYEITSISLP